MLRPTGDWLARVEFAAGETFRFDGAHIHRMRHAAGETALTVHVYSPPLGRAGAYELVVRRHAAPPQHRGRRGAARERHVPGAPRGRGSARARRRSEPIELRRVSRAGAAPRTRGGSPLELAPDADQRRPDRQRRIAVRLVVVERARDRAATRQPLQPEGVAAARVDDVEAGQRERLERRVVLARRVARELAHALGGVGRERDELARRPAGAVARLAPPGGCSKIAATGAARCSAAPSRRELGDRVVQRERERRRSRSSSARGERVGIELASSEQVAPRERHLLQRRRGERLAVERDGERARIDAHLAGAAVAHHARRGQVATALDGDARARRSAARRPSAARARNASESSAGAAPAPPTWRRSSTGSASPVLALPSPEAP